MEKQNKTPGLTKKQKEQFNFLSQKINLIYLKNYKISKNLSRVTAVVGSTGIGKSTLVSYLLNAPMKVERKKGIGNQYLIDHNDKTGKYPNIGHTKQSCTTEPGIFVDNENEETYIDLAGWYDTRSNDQQILNGISSSNFFQIGKEVKIMMVVSLQQILNSRGGVFVERVDMLMKYFPDDYQKMIRSTLLVISKCKPEESNIQDLESQLQDICLQNKKMNETTKFLVRYLIKNKKIDLFPVPTENIKNYIQVIKKDIKNIRPTILSSPGQVIFSDGALTMILGCLDSLNSSLKQLGNEFSDSIQSQFKKKKIKDKFQANQYLSQLKEGLKILKQDMQNCVSNNNFYDKLGELTLKLHVSNQLKDQIIKNFNMIIFYSNLNKRNKIDKSFNQIIKSKLKEIILKVQSIRNGFVNAEEKEQMDLEYKILMNKKDKENQERINKQKQLNQQRYKKIQKQLKEQENQYQIEKLKMYDDAKVNPKNLQDQAKRNNQRLAKQKQIKDKKFETSGLEWFGGEVGRIIGRAVGGAVGVVAGGTVGTVGGPVGTVGGATVGGGMGLVSGGSIGQKIGQTIGSAANSVWGYFFG